MMTLTPIAYIDSPYKEKFGTPRQPGLVADIVSKVVLVPPFNEADAVRGLADFSHIWLQFIFHQTQNAPWQALVRPPRLGGNKKIGVFASRATHRPNALGLSLVRLLEVDVTQGVVLTVAGADLIHGTPVVDIKPYLPFVEAKPHAKMAYVTGAPPLLAVHWSDQALADLQHYQQTLPDLAALITQVLAQDPRPAYHEDPERLYGLALFDFNIRFKINEFGVTVVSINTAV
jgi:tRNA-Thr(GGU) m(6)t(6)A37 methyltransferase TsaA